MIFDSVRALESVKTVLQRDHVVCHHRINQLKLFCKAYYFCNIAQIKNVKYTITLQDDKASKLIEEK